MSMMQDKFAKRIDVSQHRLSKELGRVREAEKSAIRMIDANRRRFRMKHKKLGYSSASTASKVMDVNADDTYTGSSADYFLDYAKDETLLTKSDQQLHSYDAFRSMIFTDNEVDLNKILLLHLLTAYAAESNDEQSTSLTTEKELFHFTREVNKNSLNGPWNDILPCYIVKIQRDKLEFHKRQKPEQVLQQQKDNFIRNFELDCNQLVEDCKENDRAVQTRNLALSYASTESPGPPYEYADTSADKNSDLHLEKHLDSGESIMNSKKTDLKNTDATSKMLNTNLTKQQSTSSFICANSKKSDSKKQRKKMMYFHPSTICTYTYNEKYNITSICINNPLRNLVQGIVEVLQVVNPNKIENIVEVLKNPKKISTVLKAPKTKLFLQSLKNYSIVSLPENYIFTPIIEIEEDDIYVNSHLRKHIIARTLEISSILDFDDLLMEIKKNRFTFQKSLSKDLNTIDNSIEKTKLEPIKSKTSNSLVNNDKNKSFVMKTSKCKNNVEKSESRTSNQSGSYKSLNQSETQKIYDFRIADPDRIILHRMTNAQRILVGQMCASLKTKKINNEGFLKQRVPLISLLTPVLSQECIRNLTEGTVYAQENKIDETEDLKNDNYIADGNLTHSIIAKLCHEVAESETRRKLENFMKKTI